jgi:hypothetical protein
VKTALSGNPHPKMVKELNSLLLEVDRLREYQRM